MLSTYFWESWWGESLLRNWLGIDWQVVSNCIVCPLLLLLLLFSLSVLINRIYLDPWSLPFFVPIIFIIPLWVQGWAKSCVWCLAACWVKPQQLLNCSQTTFGHGSCKSKNTTSFFHSIFQCCQRFPEAMFRGDVNVLTHRKIYNVCYQYTKDMITQNTFHIVLLFTWIARKFV